MGCWLGGCRQAEPCRGAWADISGPAMAFQHQADQLNRSTVLFLGNGNEGGNEPWWHRSSQVGFGALGTELQ